MTARCSLTWPLSSSLLEGSGSTEFQDAWVLTWNGLRPEHVGQRSIACYGGWLVNSRGKRIPGSIDYTITFTADRLPQARFLWSATLYTLPERLLSANEIDRYSISDRAPGLVWGDDGSLTLYVQHHKPLDPRKAANWLSSPDGPFTVIIRTTAEMRWSRRDLPASAHHATNPSERLPRPIPVRGYGTLAPMGRGGGAVCLTSRHALISPVADALTSILASRPSRVMDRRALHGVDLRIRPSLGR